MNKKIVPKPKNNKPLSTEYKPDKEGLIISWVKDTLVHMDAMPEHVNVVSLCEALTGLEPLPEREAWMVMSGAYNRYRLNHEADVQEDIKNNKTKNKVRVKVNITVHQRKKEKRLTRKQRAALLKANKGLTLTPRWRALRIRVLSKYGRKCMCCNTIDAEWHVDHIKPKSKYPELAFVFDNLQVLCKRCNELKSDIHETDYRPKKE